MPPPIRELEVRTLAELVDLVTPDRPDPHSGRLRERAVYRGVADTAYNLLTSLDRLSLPDGPPHAKGHLEEHLLRHFIRYSRPYLALEPANAWELLVVAQHHGLPTRLLDWSQSPLVAAHFATIKGKPGTNRVVWKLDWGRIHDHFGLPALAQMVQDLDEILAARGVRSIWHLCEDPRGPDEAFVCMLEPPALDERIVAQSAAFTFSSDKTRSLDQILSEAGLADCLTRCVIPKEHVERVRDQLDLCGVDERRLFPGLDGLARELRRYYASPAWTQVELEPRSTRADSERAARP